MSAQMSRTGKMVAFLDLHIGSPFFAHDRYWVRTDFDAATELRGSEDGLRSSTCNFIIDGTTIPARGPYSHEGETCEEVEAVRFETIPTTKEKTR